MSVQRPICFASCFVRSAAAIIALVVGAVGTMEAHAASANLLIVPTTDTNNVNGTIGYKFAAAVDPEAPTIRGLGFVDAGGDGLATSHQVGLYHWNGSAYALARSVTIGAGTAYYLDGGYRWYPIADYTLSDLRRTTYFLGATVGERRRGPLGGVSSLTFKYRQWQQLQHHQGSSLVFLLRPRGMVVSREHFFTPRRTRPKTRSRSPNPPPIAWPSPVWPVEATRCGGVASAPDARQQHATPEGRGAGSIKGLLPSVFSPPVRKRPDRSVAPPA